MTLLMTSIPPRMLRTEVRGLVPEFNKNWDLVEYDSFAVGIYCGGKEYILDISEGHIANIRNMNKYYGCSILRILVDAMREPNPRKRLNIK